MKSSIFVLDPIKPFKVARRILLTQTVESKTEFEFCCWPCSSFPVVFILFVYITQSEFYLAINGKTETSCPLHCVLNCLCLFSFCQALSISQSLNLSLSLRDRDRADTIITLYHTTENFLGTLRWLIVKCDTSFESWAQALLISTQKK